LQYDERDLYEEELRPTPRGGNSLKLLACAVAIGAGWAAWQMHLRAVSRMTPAEAPVAALGVSVSTKSAASTPVVPDVVVPAQPSVVAAAAVAQGPAAQERTPTGGAEAQPAPVPQAPAEGRRIFYGVVYDVATKKPAAGLTLNFSSVQEMSSPGMPTVTMPEVKEASTDNAGHYLVEMPSEADQIAVVVKSDGNGGRLEDYDPPLREIPEQKRRYLVSQRDDYRDPLRPLFSPSQDVVPFNIVLIPDSWLPKTPSER
jgi:hypothetical protein